MPLGLFITTKANLLAGKYTFFYSPLVLWWPPLSHFKGKREFFLASPWLQHLFKISYNIPNIGKKALHHGSRLVLLSRNRHLHLPLRSLGSLGQLWLGRWLEWASQFMCAQPSPSKWQNAMQYTKPNAGCDHSTLFSGLNEPALRPDLSLVRWKLIYPHGGLGFSTVVQESLFRPEHGLLHCLRSRISAEKGRRVEGLTNTQRSTQTPKSVK